MLKPPQNTLVGGVLTIWTLRVSFFWQMSHPRRDGNGNSIRSLSAADIVVTLQPGETTPSATDVGFAIPGFLNPRIELPQFLELKKQEVPSSGSRSEVFVEFGSFLEKTFALKGALSTEIISNFNTGGENVADFVVIETDIGFGPQSYVFGCANDDVYIHPLDTWSNLLGEMFCMGDL